MKQIQRVAVITGDIVGSTKVKSSRHRDKLLAIMKESFAEVKQSEGRLSVPQPFEIFRGDSFQGIVTDIKKSLLVALKIKAGLQMRASEIQSARLQARISIGIGKTDAVSKKIKENNGEAFQLSGKHLDKMKELNQGIIIITANDEINKHLELACLLLDSIISRWTVSQAEVIYHWLNGKTQNEMASLLKLSQPSVNQRMQLGNKKEIEKTLHYFDWLIDKL